MPQAFGLFNPDNLVLRKEVCEGGHEDGIPIAEELRPYLREAIDASGSEWVFPRLDGSQHPENVVLVNVLRATLRRAQIVTGYIHKCRRPGCGHREEAADGDLRRCPKCNYKLWPVGKVLRSVSTIRATPPPRC